MVSPGRQHGVGVGEVLMTYHIHHHHRARDCDGPFESWNDYVPDPDCAAMQNVDPTDDMDIAMFYLMPLLFSSPDPHCGPVTITIDQDDHGRYQMESGRQTDEGFSADSYVVCDCSDFEPARSQRDYYAEAMGY